MSTAAVSVATLTTAVPASAAASGTTPLFHYNACNADLNYGETLGSNNVVSYLFRANAYLGPHDGCWAWLRYSWDGGPWKRVGKVLHGNPVHQSTGWLSAGSVNHRDTLVVEVCMGYNTTTYKCGAVGRWPY